MIQKTTNNYEFISKKKKKKRKMKDNTFYDVKNRKIIGPKYKKIIRIVLQRKYLLSSFILG